MPKPLRAHWLLELERLAMAPAAAAAAPMIDRRPGLAAAASAVVAVEPPLAS